MFKPKSSDDQINNQEAGYTILEAIIAILIVTVLMSVVAPVIGFSVGTRVSAKRIELASQAARSYLDWVKVDSCTQGNVTTTNCGRSPKRFNKVALEELPAPAVADLASDCIVNGQYCTTTATNYSIYCVDGDGDGKCSKTSMKDMIVQATSYNGDWLSSVPEYYKGYKLGIRVYRADAFNEQKLEILSPSSSVNSIGGNRRYPLMRLTTEIAPTEDSFNNLKNRLE